MILCHCFVNFSIVTSWRLGGNMSAIYSTSKPTYFMKFMLCLKNVTVTQWKFYKRCSICCCHMGYLWYKTVDTALATLQLITICNLEMTSCKKTQSCWTTRNFWWKSVPTLLQLATEHIQWKQDNFFVVSISCFKLIITVIFKWIGKVSMQWWACSSLHPLPAEAGCKTYERIVPLLVLIA